MVQSTWVQIVCGAATVLAFLSCSEGAPVQLPKGCPTTLIDEAPYLRTFGGLCYWFAPYRLRAPVAASRVCSEHGGTILEIKTKAVLQFIVDKMTNDFIFDRDVWLNIKKTGYTYRWSDSSNVDTSIFPVFYDKRGALSKCYEFNTDRGGYVSAVKCGRRDSYHSEQNNIICQFGDDVKTGKQKRFPKSKKGKSPKSRKNQKKNAKGVVISVGTSPATVPGSTSRYYQGDETEFVTRTEKTDPTPEAYPDAETAKPKVEEGNPPTEAAKPKVEEGNPPTEAAKPKVEEVQTTPEPVRKPKCETFVCQEDCMFFGYKKDPETNCPICECDYD